MRLLALLGYGTGLLVLALVPGLARASPDASAAPAQGSGQGAPVPPTCAQCMNPSDGILKIPCSMECRRALAAGDSHASSQLASCRGIRDNYILAVSFPPDTPVLKVLEWWHMITCQKFLVPRMLGSRKVTVFPYSVTGFDGTRSLILAMLESAGLVLAREGQYQRVIEAPSRPAPGGRVLSKTAVEQLTIDATVMSQVRPSALVYGPKEPSQVVRLGDRIGKQAWRLAEIHQDSLVLAVSDRGADGGVPTFVVRAVQPGENWKIGQGAIGTPGMK